MLQFRTLPLRPKRLNDENVYGIVTRGTLYGFHRPILHQGFDRECTKSVLWCSPSKAITQNLMAYLDKDMRNGYTYTQLNDKLQVPKQFSRWGSIMPLHMEQFPLVDLETLCILHNFDLYIAVSWEAQNIGYTDDVTMNCYEFTTSEPQRKIVERYMRDMLYKKN